LDRSSPEPPIQEPALGAAFEENPTAQVVVGNDGNVYHANRAARRLLHIEQSDIGRPLQDLEFSYRPVELRSLIDEARESGQPAERRGVVVQHEGTATLTLNILVKPLLWEGRTLGFDVLYADISQFQDLRQELETSNQELETAMEELQSSNEELETTNEELQSTNEELETTNEELQSTNEELETMNEELQSTNEELETVNQELHERNTEVDRLNRFMSAMLGGIEAALVVLASDLRVEAWNRRSEDMWGLRAEEVNGQSFLNLDIGLPLQQIRDLLRAFISGDGGGSAEVDARNRSGHSFRCQLTLSKLKGDGSSENIMLMMVEAPPGASR
jgi:two-component system CheB/CheR fusion protein